MAGRGGGWSVHESASCAPADQPPPPHTQPQLGAGAVSKASYSLHLVAILLDLCAFSMLCVAWSRPLQISRDHEKVGGVLFVLL